MTRTGGKQILFCGVAQRSARLAHNQQAIGSNPVSAPNLARSYCHWHARDERAAGPKQFGTVQRAALSIHSRLPPRTRRDAVHEGAARDGGNPATDRRSLAFDRNSGTPASRSALGRSGGRLDHQKASQAPVTRRTHSPRRKGWWASNMVNAARKMGTTVVPGTSVPFPADEQEFAAQWSAVIIPISTTRLVSAGGVSKETVKKWREARSAPNSLHLVRIAGRIRSIRRWLDARVEAGAYIESPETLTGIAQRVMALAERPGPDGDMARSILRGQTDNDDGGPLIGGRK